jgi:hypothetical protein
MFPTRLEQKPSFPTLLPVRLSFDYHDNLPVQYKNALMSLNF